MIYIKRLEFHTLMERKQNREGFIEKTNQTLFTVLYTSRFISTVLMSYKNSFFLHFCIREKAGRLILAFLTKIGFL